MGAQHHNFTEKEFNKGTVMIYFHRTLKELHQLYDEFKKTKSYAAIIERLLINERTNKNLELLNMTIVVKFK